MLTLNATPSEITELEQFSRSHPIPHLREKAGALVKIANGQTATFVAQYGLPAKRTPKTVSSWVHTFNESGFDGLEVSPGRGRKPAFFPSACQRSQA